MWESVFALVQLTFDVCIYQMQDCRCHGRTDKHNTSAKCCIKDSWCVIIFYMSTCKEHARMGRHLNIEVHAHIILETVPYYIIFTYNTGQSCTLLTEETCDNLGIEVQTSPHLAISLNLLLAFG